jgi:hypothetical protein
VELASVGFAAPMRTDGGGRPSPSLSVSDLSEERPVKVSEKWMNSR